MDRVINYDGEEPATLDVLNSSKAAQIGHSFFNTAMFGTSTVQSASYAVTGPVVQGLACTPTVPTADMNIHIAPGAIYAPDTEDATAYSDLGTDAAVVLKQGILYAAQTLLVSPPTLTAGQSVNILVEIELLDVDDTSTVVQYYSGQPNPLWGSNFAATQALGTPQNTTRNVRCNVQLKNGVAAATGSQVTPTPDSGYTGLYVVTVPVGYTQILSTYITSYQIAGAAANSALPARSLPYFPNLPAIPPDLQQSVWTYATDSGVLNAPVATNYPLVTALVAGLMVQVKAGFTNTSTVTFNYNGLGAKAVHRATGSALSAGDITAGELLWMIYDGVAWQIVNFIGPISTTQTNFFNTFSVAYGVDHGTVNNLLVSPNPVITSLTAGLVIAVKVANANTGPTTLTISTVTGTPATPVLENQLPLQNQGITVGEIILLEYDGANFQKQPQRWPYYSNPVQLATAPDQYLAINDQAIVTFNSATSVPLNILAVPGFYNIEFVCGQTNAQNITVYLLPNDTTGSFTNWQTFISVAADTDAQAPDFPPMVIQNSTSAFQMQTGTYPTHNGFYYGPFNVGIDCCTVTATKFIRYFGGGASYGGGFTGNGTWNDTTTPWTSLGTLIVGIGTPMSPAATVSGVAIVRRLG